MIENNSLILESKFLLEVLIVGTMMLFAEHEFREGDDSLEYAARGYPLVKVFCGVRIVIKMALVKRCCEKEQMTARLMPDKVRRVPGDFNCRRYKGNVCSCSRPHQRR
jgi:hypothetical protein